MTAHRFDLGEYKDPVQAGNPVRIDVTVWTNSGHPDSYSIQNLNGATDLRYALFALQGDLPVASPTLVLTQANSGVVVTNASLGQAAIHLTSSHTSLLTGRDWHVARLINEFGDPYDLFDGFVISTRALDF
jgi:hypothetical protein